MDRRHDMAHVNELMDRARFEAFYDRALPLVYGYLWRRCGQNENDAMDLTQETFLGAVRAIRAGVEVEDPLPWLMSIARRRLVDYYRRREVRQRPYPLVQTNDPSPAEIDVADAKLTSALESLPHHYRVALVLRYVDDLPVDELAGLLGKSPVATESLLARARAALANTYEAQPDE